MDETLEQNNLNCEHIQNILNEIATKYNYAYMQLYYFVFKIIEEEYIPISLITKDMIETSIKKHIQKYKSGVNGVKPSFVVYDDIEFRKGE